MAKARRKSNEELEARLTALEELLPVETGTWNMSPSNATGTIDNALNNNANYARIGNVVFCWGSSDFTFSGNGDYTVDFNLPVAGVIAGSLSGTYDRTAGNNLVAGSIGDVATFARFIGYNTTGVVSRATSFMFSYRIS